jgi:predicted O-methyltransferase YrrM
MDNVQVMEALVRIECPQLTTPDEGRQLYDFILEQRPSEILELGFAHGSSTAYMAGAIAAAGVGKITSIDRDEARERVPNAEKVLRDLGLDGYVELVYTPTSYTWELMKMIQARTTSARTDPVFDFAFIDGAHTWEVDGLAFFLVDKLLRPGGWILFDDVHWTFANSAALKNSPRVQAMPEDERTTPQVMKVVSLLALQHPSYGNLRVGGNWAWIQKLSNTENGSNKP